MVEGPPAGRNEVLGERIKHEGVVGIGGMSERQRLFLGCCHGAQAAPAETGPPDMTQRGCKNLLTVELIATTAVFSKPIGSVSKTFVNRKLLPPCSVSEITIHSLRSNW